jgi:capsular exopolysaccharide synthesis family protein
VDPAQVIEALRRSWWVVVLGAVFGLCGGTVANATTTVQYMADVQQFVSFADTSDTSANALSGAQFTLQRVKSYTQVATSDQVLGPVVRDLRLPMTSEALAAEITASNPLDTVLIQISVTDSDPKKAALLANAVAEQFGQVVEELERPPGGGDSPVKVSVTQPAAAPTMPVSPRTKLNLALGLLAGLALGAGGALLRARLDTTLKSREDVTALTGSVPLGLVPVDPEVKEHPLVISDPTSSRAEAFRTLRTNLQFADVDHPPRVIVVTSPLPGDGKSTSTCNIALTLAMNGSTVALVDADLRRPRVCEYMGVTNEVGLTNVLAGQLGADDALVSWKGGLIDVLPSGPVPPNPSELLGSQQMDLLLKHLSKRYEYVVIDSAPLLPVTDAAVLATLADGALIVLRHGTTTVDQGERALQALSTVNARLLGTVINFVPSRKRAARYSYQYDYRPEPGRQRRSTSSTAHPAGFAGQRRVPMVGPRDAVSSGPQDYDLNALTPAVAAATDQASPFDPDDPVGWLVDPAAAPAQGGRNAGQVDLRAQGWDDSGAVALTSPASGRHRRG